jgi:hypothetical protein
MRLPLPGHVTLDGGRWGNYAIISTAFGAIRSNHQGLGCDLLSES